MDILKVTSSLNTRNSTLAIHQHVNTNEVFNIVDLSKITKANDRSEEFRQTDNSDSNSSYNIRPEINIPTKTLFSTQILKNLLNEDFIALLQNSTSPETINTFNDFCKNIFLDENTMLNDLLLQEKGQTRFNGEFFDSLRTIYYNTNSKELQSSIVNLLKNISLLSSQESIIESVKNNLLFLSDKMIINPNLSENLNTLADKFLPESMFTDFENLISETAKLLDLASNSIIATDDCKDLINLIKYNLTKLNNNPEHIKSSFENILNLIDNESVKEMLKLQFSHFLQGNAFSELSKKALLSNDTNFADIDKTVYNLSDKIQSFLSSLSTDNIIKQLEILAPIINESALDSSDTNNSVPLEIINIKKILSQIIPTNASDELSQILENFSSTKDLNALINRLQFILNNINDTDVKLLLQKLLNISLTNLTKSSEINYQPPASTQYLVDFLAKTLNNDNFPLLGIVDPDTLVQSMLTCPGVFTPLLHYVLPVKNEYLQAFGEVWINNPTIESGEPNTDNINHIFLTFDIDNVGIFEMELFTQRKNIDISLKCPHSLSKLLVSVKPTVRALINKQGYSLAALNISELTHVRNLNDVFPHLKERRKGINAKA